MLWLGVSLISVLLGKYIYSWYAEIKKRNRYMEAQIRLLEQIALKQGVDEKYVNKIMDTANVLEIKEKETKLERLW